MIKDIGLVLIDKTNYSTNKHNVMNGERGTRESTPLFYVKSITVRLSTALFLFEKFILLIKFEIMCKNRYEM